MPRSPPSSTIAALQEAAEPPPSSISSASAVLDLLRLRSVAKVSLLRSVHQSTNDALNRGAIGGGGEGRSLEEHQLWMVDLMARLGMRRERSGEEPSGKEGEKLREMQRVAQRVAQRESKVWPKETMTGSEMRESHMRWMWLPFHQRGGDSS